jgi:hypothetical protein|tara:strand:- start:68 stop:286 length:219 start_codon:yes stop_codon:yes gene_type:complete
MSFLSKSEIEAQGIDFEELVSYVANEWADGCCQNLCTEAEANDGMHYRHAKDFLAMPNATDIIAEYLSEKTD